MHELGVLCQIVKKVNQVALDNQINQVKHITLEVGEASSFVPIFLEKLFPVAVENFPAFDGTNRARTCDPLLVRQVLSQLSYDPIHFHILLS